MPKWPGNIEADRDLEFTYCVIGSCWGPWKNERNGNRGGFIIQYGAKDFGFGEVTFHIDDCGRLICDAEDGPRKFVERAVIELVKRAFMRDDVKDCKSYRDRRPVVYSQNRHGFREEIMNQVHENNPGAKMIAACDGYEKDFDRTKNVAWKTDREPDADATVRFSGPMNIQTTFSYYDGPLIFTFLDNQNQLILAYILFDDKDDKETKYALTTITEQESKDLDEDKITCREIFEKNPCWVLANKWKEEGVVCWEIDFSELPEVIKKGMALPWHT